MQWPPTPTPGLNGINPYGFDDAAVTTLFTSNPAVPHSIVNSLMSQIFTNLKVFSSNFAASAISGVSTDTTASQIER